MSCFLPCNVLVQKIVVTIFMSYIQVFSHNLLSCLYFVTFLFLVWSFYMDVSKLLLIFELRLSFWDQIIHSSINNIRYAWRMSSYHRQIELPLWSVVTFSSTLDSVPCKLKVRMKLCRFLGFFLFFFLFHLSPSTSFSLDNKT